MIVSSSRLEGIGQLQCYGSTECVGDTNMRVSLILARSSAFDMSDRSITVSMMVKSRADRSARKKILLVWIAESGRVLGFLVATCSDHCDQRQTVWRR